MRCEDTPVDACNEAVNNIRQGIGSDARNRRATMDDRRMHQKATMYDEDVDRAVADNCGVGYRELISMAPGLDPNGRALARGAERGMSAEAFAEEFRVVHNMVSFDGGDAARAHNERRAALVEFASSGRWKMGEDGAATMETSSGTICLDVVERDGRMGFGARRIDDPEDTAYVRLDIGDTVRGFLLRLRNTQDAAPEAEATSGMRLG